MLPKDILKAHYAEYGSQPDSWIENMESTKKSILQYIFETSRFQTAKSELKVVVLGTSDKRYIPMYQKILSELFNQKIEFTLLDIDTEHLAGAEGVIQHDVTQPLPNGPYDVVISHALLKFLTDAEQLATIKNSFSALNDKGIAMHIVHPPELEGTAELRDWQFRVRLDKLAEELDQAGIAPQIMRFESDSSVDWLRDTTALVLRK